MNFMRVTTLFFVLISLLSIAFSSPCYSQTGSFVTKKTLKILIDTLASKIDNRYVLPDKAYAMSNYIKKRYN